MKRIALLASVAACSPGAREEPMQDAAVTVDAVTLPEGVWEPDPGLGRASAYILADGNDVWFAYARAGAMGASEVWLTKTTSTGDVVVAPVRADGPELAAWPKAIARSGDNLAVVWQHSSGSLPPRLRMYDRNGQPLRDMGHLVPISTLGGTYISNLALVGRADGTMRLFADYEYDAMSTELAMVDLDASGDPIGAATLFGTADGGTPVGLAGAVEADGSTIVAWDRLYDECMGQFDPDATVVTTIASDGQVGPIADISPSGRSDREPSLAASGSTAYLAWTSETDAGRVIRLARSTDAAPTIVDLGNAPLGNRTPMVALAEPGRGAIAWGTDEPSVRIAGVHDDGTTIAVGATHVIPLPPGRVTLRGIVHVGDERYVVSWTDDSWTAERARLYALVVDLAIAPRPVPAGMIPAIDTSKQRSRRCSH